MKQMMLGLLALAIVALAATSASAGGWAVTTLDSVPVATAGQTVEIGFTIRQHGVAPVNPDGEVGIVFRPTSGPEEFFAARPDGGVGHYLVDVTFPAEGTWTWAVRQGWFQEQELGTIEIAAPGASVAGERRGPEWLRYGLPAVAVLLGAAALVDLRSGRRPRIVAA